MSNFKIFGREPVAVVSGVEAVLAVALSFGLFGLTNDQAGGIVTVVSAVLAVVVAYATKNTLLSAITGLAKALMLGVATFGFSLDSGQQAAILTLIAVVGGAWLRQNNASTETAVSSASPGATSVVGSPVFVVNS